MQTHLIASFALTLLLGSCAFSDLRTHEVRDAQLGSTSEQRGSELLEEALDAAGGRSAWERVRSADLLLEDEWHGVVGTLFCPWPGNPTKLRVRYDLGMRGTQVEFLSKKRRGESWGREGDRTWSMKPGEELVYRKRESVRFMLAAYQYFFELPIRITEAPIVFYAGRRQRDDREYELIFATWGDARPHEEHDQYRLWIATDTGLIEIVEYTIRDKYDFATGSNRFSDFREVGGLVIPHSYSIAQELDGTIVHEAQLEDVRFSQAP